MSRTRHAGTTGPAGGRRPRAALTAVTAAVALLAGCTAASSPAASTGSPTVAAVRSPAPASPAAATAAGVSPAAGATPTRATPAGGTGDAGQAPAAAVDLYAADRPGRYAPEARLARPLVYVPDSGSDTVTVIDPATYRVVTTVRTGKNPQHVTPSWDLRTLWVDNDLANTLTPIDPRTGAFGRSVPVDDPYNLYFTTDGRSAVVVAEQRQRLDFRDPHTMALQQQLHVPCPGVDHMDFTADGSHALVSCEFGSRLIWVDMRNRVLDAVVPLPAGSMPQDVKTSPDGSVFYVADMMHAGVYVVDAGTRRVLGLVHTGSNAHGLYVSRDSRTLYVTNRLGHSVSLIDLATREVRATWPIPGGTPDMGGVSGDGRVLWLSGRYSREVYALDTSTGRLLARIPVGDGPHGLCVWPQPGRYSLGHTGILR